MVDDIHKHLSASNLNLDSTGTTTSMDNWGWPDRVKVDIYHDRIEMIYKETSNITHTYDVVFSDNNPEVRVYKIIYSCKNGMWDESEKIYGTIIEAQDERYEFD